MCVCTHILDTKFSTSRGVHPGISREFTVSGYAFRVSTVRQICVFFITRSCKRAGSTGAPRGCFKPIQTVTSLKNCRIRGIGAQNKPIGLRWPMPKAYYYILLLMKNPAIGRIWDSSVNVAQNSCWLRSSELVPCSWTRTYGVLYIVDFQCYI